MQKDLHVLHVVVTLGRGGLEINLQRIVHALIPRGISHSIAVVSDIYDEVTFDDAVRIIPINAKPNDPRLILQLEQLISRLRPDVIHARNWGAWPDVTVARLLTRPRAPLIFSFHGTEETQIPLRRKIAFNLLSHMTTHLFAVSESSRQMLIETCKITEPIHVIGNGVNTKRFAARPWREPQDPIILGALGRIAPVKNVPLLIRAGARLIQEGLNLEIKIAGEGDLDGMRTLARSLDIEDKVHLLGHTEDVPTFLRSLDLFVIPSRTEASPNALLQAMATQLPCIGTDVGGIAEVLDRGRYGEIVPSEDEQQLAASIRGLVTDPERMRRTAESARMRIEQDYSAKRMMDKYEALYRSMTRS